MPMLVACMWCSIKVDFGSNTVDKLLQMAFFERKCNILQQKKVRERESYACMFRYVLKDT